MTIDIEPAGLATSELLATLHGQCLSPGWSQTTIAGLIASPGGGGWIAVLNSNPVGFVLTREAADEAEILSIGVLPDYRRSGIGNSLLATVVDHCISHKLSHLFLEVAASNSAALCTYKRAGFVPVGRRRGYYRSAGSAEDAIIMRRQLM